MLTPRGPTVETIRYAAQRAVARSSLRKVAGEMGMAVSWLNGFVLGKETELRAKTLRHLREWYVRSASDLAEQDAGTAAGAIEFLIGGILEDGERAKAYGRVLQAVARAYSDQGPLPEWVRTLLDREDDGER
ncbi:MAG TPA: hypothetical protein VEX86_16270 [Longimicrobium sp.]|nr:hypothetical protein [Longimicrobium sp.]